MLYATAAASREPHKSNPVPPLLTMRSWSFGHMQISTSAPSEVDELLAACARDRCRPNTLGRRSGGAA